MFEHVVEWVRVRIAMVSTMVMYGAGFFWIGTVFVKFFRKEPISYAHGSVELTSLMIICGFLLFAAAYQIVFFTLWKRPAESFLLELVAPWVFAISAVSLAIWLYAGVSNFTAMIPLLSTAAISGVLSYSVWYGFMSERSGWIQSKQKALLGGGNTSEPVVARAKVPTKSFAQILGNEAVKARLLEAGKLVMSARSKDSREPRNGVLLHGDPGNGKTVFAEALAGELKLPFLQLSVADVASKWVGEKTSRIRQAFDQAMQSQPCMLFIDEIDALLEARDGNSGGVKEDRDAVNALLTLMVDVRAHRVLLVAATNHLDRLDGAGIREGRFDFKVEITAPDAVARRGLLAAGMRSNLPGVQVSDAVLDAVSDRWNGFSAKRILAVTEELPSYLDGRTVATFDDFMGALRVLQGQRGTSLEGAKPLAELVLAPDAKEAIELIVGRMADPEYTERHGGTLPTGVLLFGPPGTGKTATCKAIAKELGWAFLPATGAGLARSPKDLEKLYLKAKELRPAIIFIDEADELLKNREFSQYTEATNTLLTLTEGVGQRVKDVVWFAATNHPDNIDPALLRGGRFTEKVLLDLPSLEQIAQHLQRWLAARSVRLDDGFSFEKFAEMVGQVSIANGEAVAQAALNRAVARREASVIVRQGDVEQATRLVLG